MIYLAYAAGTVALLIALLALIGATLPRDHVASASARIAATPAAIWPVISDPTALVPAGQRPLPIAIDASEPPSRLVTRITDTSLPFGGSWEWQIAPDGNAASEVTITERGSVYNPIFRFVSRFIIGHEATMQTQLRALAKRVEGDRHGA